MHPLAVVLQVGERLVHRSTVTEDDVPPAGSVQRTGDGPHGPRGVEQGKLPLLTQGGGTRFTCDHEGCGPELLQQAPEIHQTHHLGGRRSVSG